MHSASSEKMVIYRDPGQKAKFFENILFMSVGPILGGLTIFILLLKLLPNYGWAIIMPLYFILGLIISSVIYMIYTMLSQWKSPVMILDQDGVLMPHFRRIAWCNIAEIGPPSPVFITIKIRVKDRAKLVKQADFEGKIGLFWAKFGCADYHILATGLDRPNDAIIAFARQYMQSDTQN